MSGRSPAPSRCSSIGRYRQICRIGRFIRHRPNQARSRGSGEHWTPSSRKRREFAPGPTLISRPPILISLSPSKPMYVAGAVVLSIAGAATLLATQVSTGGHSFGSPSIPSAPLGLQDAPPAIAPLELLPIDPAVAKRVNADMSNAVGAGPSAAPFIVAGSGLAATRAVQCLAQAIYYEAASESVEGQRAVAQVVLNRVRNSAFPSSVCGVVYQGAERVTGCQFTFTCDGSLGRTPSRWGWDRANTIAIAALKGAVFAPVGNATHYHADWVLPYWAPTLAKITRVGAHIFYRWKGRWGTPVAFQGRYSGQEPDVASLMRAAPLQVAAEEAALDADLPGVLDWSNPQVVKSQSELPGSRLGAGPASPLRSDRDSGILVEKLERRADLRLDDRPGELSPRAGSASGLRIDRERSRATAALPGG